MKARSGPGPLPASIPRLEDERLITGQGRFVADLAPPDALVACFVRSPFARGELINVDVSAAAALPGVVAVYTAADLGLKDLPVTRPGPLPGMERPMLARDRVNFVGETLAVVVAESAAVAADAASLVFPDVDVGEAVVGVAESMLDTSIIHPDAGTNIAFRQHTSSGPELAPDLTEISVTVEHPRLAPSPIEALAALATPNKGGVHLHVGSQAAHDVQHAVAEALDIGVEQVRVTVPDVGGAFGMKRFYTEYAVLAKAALLLGRPVLWAQSRREIFLGGSHGRGQRHEVTLSVTPDGRIHGARFRLLADCGAYPHRGVIIPILSRLVATGLYDIARVDFEVIAVVTNLPPTAPYRGAGRPEAALAIERAVDEVARNLGLDPADVRRRNMVAELPHETPTGARLDSGDYRAALDRALELVGYDNLREEQHARRESGGKPLGIGIGAFVERAGGQPDSWEFGEVEIGLDGEIVARTGSTSAGQGHETMWRRVVAEVFDVAPTRIDLVAGDTDEVADSVGSFASRSTQIGASAVWRCAERVRVVASELAAELFEAAPSDIRISSGEFFVAGTQDQRLTLAEVGAFARKRQVDLRSEERYSPGVQTFPYGVHVAVVEVDTETGVVTPLSLVAVDDVGRVLDEMLVEGQVHGSVVQGLGAALFEQMHYGADGQPQAATFVDYKLPSALHLPPVQTEHLSHPAPSNPLGAKGAGEGGCIGMPPAILSATLDALAPLGVSDLQIPLTPEKVWAAINSSNRIG